MSGQKSRRDYNEYIKEKVGVAPTEIPV